MRRSLTVALLVLAGLLAAHDRHSTARAQVIPYQLTVSANPAVVGPGAGATITAALFGTFAAPVVPLAGGIGLQFGAGLAPGAEPGTVTFTTTSGVFGAPATSQASGQQSVTVQCGSAPVGPVLAAPGVIPLNFNRAATACLTVSVTLYGGGSAGAAQITAQFVGQITGASALGQTTVSFAATPAWVSLSAGCNQVTTPAGLAPGTPAAVFLALVQPAGAVISAWAFDNVAKIYDALFFAQPGVPVDLTSLIPNEALFVCTSAGGMLPAPTS